MKLETRLAIIIILAFLALSLSRTPPVTIAADSNPYSLNDVYARGQIISPLEKETFFRSFTALNVSVQLSVFAYASNPGAIPYQNITSVYSLDGGEWQNVPFQCYAWKGVMPSHNVGRYYDQITCFYAIAIRNLSDGGHSISAAIKPDNVRFYYNESDHILSVNFTVKKQSSALESETQQPKLDYVMIGGATTAAIAATSLGLFFYLRKRRLALEK
jgi:hypothetical protein